MTKSLSFRLKSAAILTLGICAIFAVLLILFGAPAVLVPLGLSKAILTIVTGSFAAALAFVGFASSSRPNNAGTEQAK